MRLGPRRSTSAFEASRRSPPSVSSPWRPPLWLRGSSLAGASRRSSQGSSSACSCSKRCRTSSCRSSTAWTHFQAVTPSPRWRSSPRWASWPGTPAGARMTFVAGALFVLGVGASRVYLGVHYPADVVGGWCVAIASVAGTWLVVRTVQARTAGPMNGSRSGVKGKDDERRGAGSAEDPAPETPAALSMKSVPRATKGRSTGQRSPSPEVGCRCDSELISVKTEPQPSRP